MKKVIIFSFLFFILQSAFAQEIIFSTGISMHSLKKLKNFQNNYINNAVVTLKSTQSFPPFLQYSFLARMRVSENLKAGISVYQTSTAARSTYEDYSGKLEVDQSLRCIGTGIYTSYLINKTPKGKISVYANLGVDLSTLDLAINARVFDAVDNSKETFHATSLMAEIGIEYQHFFSKQFFLHINGGPHISQEKMLKSDSDHSEWEKVNWTGFKLMAGIGFNFTRN